MSLLSPLAAALSSLVSPSWLDPSGPRLWLLLGGSWLLLTLSPPRARPAALALVNLATVGLLTGAGGLALALAGVALLWGALALSSALAARVGARAGLAARWGGALATLSLFALHKRHDLAASAPALAPALEPALELMRALGFSYVALRALELLRFCPRAPSPRALVGYLLPFHMLTAGPLLSYEAFARAEGLAAPIAEGGAGGSAEGSAEETSAARWARWLDGGDRLARGMVKKFLLADALAGVALTGFKTTGVALWVEVNLFTVWLYLDFSAYSDIAVGAGRLCGLAAPENFCAPLGARNLTEFWERWHISLSQWLRRHLYTPIQLTLARATRNRAPALASAAAFGVSFTLCGLWHDLSWRYLSWGALHAAGLASCVLYREWLTRRFGRRWVRDVYMRSPLARLAAAALTFEFISATLYVAFS